MTNENKIFSWWIKSTVVPLPPKATSLIRPLPSKANPLLSGHSHQKPPLLSGHSHQKPTLFYQATPTKSHLSYQVRFQVHWDNEILLNCPPTREATSLIRPQKRWSYKRRINVLQIKTSVYYWLFISLKLIWIYFYFKACFWYYMSWSWSYGNWIYNYLCNQCLSPLTLWVWIPLRWGILDTTLCDKVCQWLVTGRWFSPGTPVSSANKTDCHYITEILLKVALDTITLTLTPLDIIIHCRCICYKIIEIWTKHRSYIHSAPEIYINIIF